MNKETEEYILDLQTELKEAYTENKYLSDFISYKGLSNEFVDFRLHAHEEQPEDCPFPYYTL